MPDSPPSTGGWLEPTSLRPSLFTLFQWQEGLMQPDEHFNDAAADSFTQQPPHHHPHHHNHPNPTHAPTFSPTYSSSSSVSSPAYTPTSSPTYAPTYSPTYSSTAFAPTVTVSPPPPPPPSPTHLLPTQASPSPLAAGAEREGRGKAGRRALRTPKHPRHRAGPNALDGLLASEETQYRRRVKEKMALGHFRPEGIGEHGSIPGEPGVDYPTYSKPPVPSISCLDFKGRRGYVADPSTRCQVFYICPGDGRGKAMLCPNGTVFNQDVSVCDWWFNVKCSGP
ncbi:hypothetical protein R5R35_001941 [Gryllus longicercus]|uniref:Chitin-binding type-2 domain-containing protein n=1 Tax=Gryllus longicercus TaxID=2509291 RepID=A0AAN9WJA4_9ORTH